VNRVIYCPGPDISDDASSLAAEYGLPIIVGDCAATEGLEFNRSEVQFLQLPTEQFFEVSPLRCRTGTRLISTYVDEFSPTSTVGLMIRRLSDDDVSRHSQCSIFSSQNVAIFRTVIDSPGDYVFSVYDQDGIIAIENVKVTL
jgi:hypothetical protein